MKSLLESISQPTEIQNLNLQELTQLAEECRQRIIEVTSQRGGHLASSLGTVEITVALLKNFNFNIDRIVWDVGHQAYAYKILQIFSFISELAQATEVSSLSVRKDNHRTQYILERFLCPLIHWNN